MIEIYHNPRCKKSRAGLHYVEEHCSDYKVIDYLKNPLSAEELTTLLMKLNKKPHEMIRRQEAYYKTNLKGKEFNDHEWIQILVENPKLIQRPIVVSGHKATWGDPVENIEELLK